MFYLVYKEVPISCPIMFFYLPPLINIVAGGTSRYVLRCMYRWLTLPYGASDEIKAGGTAGRCRWQRQVMYMQMAHTNPGCH